MTRALIPFLYVCCCLCPVWAFAQPTIEWQRMMGGTSLDAGTSISQTTDGGYIVAAYTTSNNGDVSGNHSPFAANPDFWVVKLSPTADIVWQRCLGGSAAEEAYAIRQTSDGGYVVAGKAASSNGDVTGHHGGNQWDFWVVRLSPDGDILWDKCLGGFGDDIARDITTTADGGFVVVGGTLSVLSQWDQNADVSFNNGMRDVWVVKLSGAGDIVWERSYGGNHMDDAYAVQQTADGGYIVAGETKSNNADVSGHHGALDFWVLKLDANGQLVWQNALGGTGNETARAVQQTADGGYIVTGETFSSDGDVSHNQGSCDFWAVKLSPDGNMEWEKTLGGTGQDYSAAVRQTPDGGYVLAGSTRSRNGDVTGGYGMGLNPNAWLVKLSPVGELEWQRCFGGLGGDNMRDVWLTQDGGYVLAGASGSNEGDVSGLHGNFDVWVVKFAPLNTVLAGRTHADPEDDCLPDDAEAPLTGWLVQAQREAQQFYAVTDAEGRFSVPLDTGHFEVAVLTLAQSPYWDICNSPTSIHNMPGDTARLDFPIQALVDCPYMTVDVGVPFLRRCFHNTYSVRYCNLGTLPAQNAYIQLTLDPHLAFVSASLPPSSQDGQTFTFDLGNVGVNQCGSFQVTTYLDCEGTVLGQTHCVEAHIFPDSLCLPPDPAWDGASIAASATCTGDSVVFTLTNAGTGHMAEALIYVIIEDQIVLRQGQFQLDAAAHTSIAVAATGTTLHLQAQQSPGHPNGRPSTGVTVEGCNGWADTGVYPQWPSQGPSLFAHSDCQPNIGSYDPNDKAGFPTGVGAEQLIEPGQALDYLIRFQNTGTDTAFRVVIVDVLPPQLDLASLRPGAASHPYTYSVSPDGQPIFTFDNILLPDSATHEAASIGFVRFHIAQRPGLPLGTDILNQALIYFDFNDPITTPPALHRLGRLFDWNQVLQAPATPDSPNNRLHISPNPASESFRVATAATEAAPLRLTLTNVVGQTVHQAQGFGTALEVQRGTLPPGVYFVRLERDGMNIGVGRVVVK